MLLLVGFGSSYAQPKIVLKLDDIAASRTRGNKAAVVMDYLISKGIKASYGVIANRLDDTASQLLGKYIKAKNKQGEAMVEIWHHGYDHSSNLPPGNSMEYKGTTLAFQRTNFNKADSLIKQYLGIQMQTFGAPFNAVDSNTLAVIASNKNYRTLFYFSAAPEKHTHLRRLNNRVNIENGTGNPNFDYFRAECETTNAMKAPYLVLQGHPLQWDELKFGEFKKIVDYLISQKCIFVLPSEFRD